MRFKSLTRMLRMATLRHGAFVALVGIKRVRHCTESQAVDIALKVLRDCPAGLAAELLGISSGTLRSWRDKGKIASSLNRRTGRYTHDVLGVLLRDGSGA